MTFVIEAAGSVQILEIERAYAHAIVMLTYCLLHDYSEDIGLAL